jgi:ASC-1-like (ASCH) protein
MAVVKKRITPEFFALVKSGQKKFEVRVADFKLRRGDTLILEEYDPKKGEYTGRKITKKAGYILKYPLDIFGQKKLLKKHGLYIITLENQK